ncbi:MAG TPA: alpha/beta hydrolase [Acidimicrobiales bacterium]|nr:alpha/beta hydrolase [Acidimicrobiales bacterium]
MSVTEWTISLPGGRVVGWHEAGAPEGRPLLWCHGGLSSSAEVVFLDAAARAAGVRVIALDRPGVGRSPLWDMGPVSRWSEVVAACADLLGFTRFAVAGWSAGGPFALACGRHLSDRLDSVTLVASMCPVSDPARRKELGLRTDRVLLPLSVRHPGVAKLVLEPYRWIPRSLLWRGTLATAGEADRRALTPSVRAPVTAMLRQAVAHGVGGVVADYARVGSDWGFPLSDVDMPVSLLQGSADGMVPPAHAEVLRALLPAATLRVIPGAGHFLPITHGAEIIDSVCG